MSEFFKDSRIHTEDLKPLIGENMAKVLMNGGTFAFSGLDMSFIEKSGDATYLYADMETGGEYWVSVAGICLVGLYRRRHFFTMKRDFQTARVGDLKRGDLIHFEHTAESYIEGDNEDEPSADDYDQSAITTYPAIFLLREDDSPKGEAEVKKVDRLVGMLGLGN
jgi:hypothetical protein